MADDLETLATQYVNLTTRIKEISTTLSALRKELKGVDTNLLDQMQSANLMEITVRGTTIQCLNKLKVVQK
jgi:hypothetical protein